MAKRTAVIDIGSNSVGMVIYEKTSRFAFHLIYESKSKVRLSQDAYKNDGNLQEIPMQRTYDALQDFMHIISSFDARKTLCVATSCVRDAPNKKAFTSRVKKELGLKIKVIDGEREAYLGGIACANLLPEINDGLSIDIGGGSTEFAYIDKKNIKQTLSLDLGTVRIKELFCDSGNAKGAKKYIDEKLLPLNNLQATKLVGIGGTFRAIATAIMQQINFPLIKLHAFEYDGNKFESFINEILDAKDNEALSKLGIKENRLDVIRPGALILQRVMSKLKTKDILTSGVGVREGLYLSDLLRNNKDKLPANFNTSVRNILDLYVNDKNYSNNLNKVSKELFDLLKNKLNLDNTYRQSIAISAKLYPSGSSIHQFAINKHSYYLIQSALEYGLSQKEMVLISTLVRYAKRKLPSTSHIKKYENLLPNVDTLNALSYILSLSIALLSNRPKNINFKLQLEGNTIVVESKDTMYLTKEAISTLETIKGLEIKISVP